jgi:hypothetical protein
MSSTTGRRREPWDDWDEPVRRTRGTRLLTPLRLLLAVLVAIAGAATLYGLLDKSALQIPIAMSGMAVLGVALGLLAFSSAAAVIGLGREGRVGLALLVAFFGGLCAFGAAGSLGGALILGMLARGG